MITGEENFLHRTLANVGVPPLHILRAHNGFEYRFYELSGDLPEALHFRHFEQTESEKPLKIGGRIRLKEEVNLAESPINSVRNRIRIHNDENPKEKINIKSSKKRARIKDETDVIKIEKESPIRIRAKETTRTKNISFKTNLENEKMS